MIQHSFDIGWGVHGFAPSPNQKKQTKSEWLEQFLVNSAKYNKMSIEEVKEYAKYD